MTQQYDQPLARIDLTLAPNDHENCKLPKNFSKPLTCFYWYYNGRCNKSDEACYYAHYHTGMVASAPVGTGRGRVIAGRQAEYHMDTLHAREEAAMSREKALRAQEEVLRREEARITQLKNRLLEGLESMDQASTDARRVLQRRRADLVALNVEGNSPENIGKILKTVDGMNGAVAGFHQQVTSAMKNLNGLDIDSFIPSTSTGRFTSAPTYLVTSTAPGTDGSTNTVGANSRAHVQIPGLTTIAPTSGFQRPHPLPARIFTEGSVSEFTEHSTQIHTPASESHPDLVIAKQE
ncbi:hypothetical protein H2201_002919 [Coniosporium apollinis]|uniref:C3H1-type domain-containing protein n=1 Tax=Coniosporium apollinis TaxID=61459 RepID=A0ABQ9P0M4_9PEZI|nr:hypothetical protein H2201_002919 [Coniosporium apollinis]